MIDAKEEDYERLLDYHYHLIGKIIQLSKEILLEEKEEIIFQKGPPLIVCMIKMYLLTLELVINYPKKKELERIKRIYQNNPLLTRSAILKEIKCLKEQYWQGIKAKGENTFSASIREWYYQMAKINLFHYQEIREKTN